MFGTSAGCGASERRRLPSRGPGRLNLALGLVFLTALAASILGIVVIAFMLLASKPRAPRVREKRSDVTPEQRVQKGNCAMVLEELKKRGIITETTVDISGPVEMPNGTWHLMDERSRR